MPTAPPAERKKSRKVSEGKEPLKGEHIFPNTRITELAIKWKHLRGKGRDTESMEVLEDIIKLSTKMFERFAQHENYHHTVDLTRLVSAAQEKVVKWLEAWDPNRRDGRIFSWFSKCAKNAFMSEVLKESQHKSRYHYTSDNLETFWGYTDHEIHKKDAADQLKSALDSITVRWNCEQQKGAIQYLMYCVLDESNHSKTGAIRAAAFAFGISFELSKFFYQWVLMELRKQFMKQVYVPFTEQDLIRASHSYTFLVDLLDIVTWDQMRKIIATMGGTRIKIPTMTQIIKLKEHYEVFKDIEDTDKDPLSVADVAKKRKKSARSAQQIYEQMMDTLSPSRTGEHELFERPISGH